MQELIATYGYPVIFVGSLLEGETIVILGAIAAKIGYLHLGLVMLAAWMGSFVGDQLYFQIGRRYGARMIARWPSWQMRAERVNRLLVKYDRWFIVGFRFIYGLRTVSPFVIGMSRVSAGRFMFWNVLAAGLWAVLIAGLGYAFGQVIELFLAELKRYELYVFGGVIAVGLLLWIAYHIRLRARSRVFAKEHAPGAKSGKPGLRA